MSDCYCDYGDPPSVYDARIVRARKQHRCTECGGVIRPGERYEYLFAVWGRDPGVIHTCEACYDLRMWVKNNVPCLCIMHGDMDQEMQSAIEDALRRAPDETHGLWFGFQRRKILRKRRNAEVRRLAT